MAFGVSGDPEFMLALSRGDGWISCAEDRGLRYELLPEILAHIPGHTLAHVVEDGPRTADEPTASPARGQPRDGRLRWGADAFAGGSRGP